MRKLTLKFDRLAELSTDQLEQVGGGEASRPFCLTDPCITRPVTGIWCLLTDGCH